MTTMWKISVMTVYVWLLLPGAGQAQDEQDHGIGSSIGLRTGYGLLQGTWADSRVAPGVEQFGGNLAFEGDIAFRLGRRWMLALGGGYMSLRGSKWEAYAQSKGGSVNVEASLAHLSLSLRPYLKSSPPDLIALEAGAVALFASGHEVFEGEWYAYDFLSSFRIGFQGGLVYDRVIAQNVALTLRAGVVAVPSGVKYADGETRAITYVPISAGIRIMM